MVILLVFLATFLGALGLIMLAMPSRGAQRLRAIGSKQQHDWTRSAVQVLGPFVNLSSPAGQWERSALRVSFIQAGLRHPEARLVFFGLKSVLPLLCAALAYLVFRAWSTMSGLSLLLLILVIATVACYVPNLLLSWRLRWRRRHLFDAFPDAVDLLQVCVEAGLGLDAALAKVTLEIGVKSFVLAEELHLTNLELRAGASRMNALRNLALRTGVDEIGVFATMLTQADKFGTSIGDSLQVFSEDLRQKRHNRAEEAAAKVAIKMLIPLVLCIFPSVLMVILGPAAIQIIRTLLPMFNGPH